VAFFDIFPSTKGQTLVIPKQHYASDLFLIEDGAFYQRYLLATKAVVDLLKKGLGVHRVAMVMEGLSVPHLHLKLYPLYPDVRFSIDSGEKADEEALKALQAQVLE
jgi:diadenosine tetraphosphate (Ap4A) HIT family hydrolase